MKLTVNTPEGTRDRLFAECQERRQVQQRLTRLFRQRGFLEVSTPETEYYDLFAHSGCAIPQERMLKVSDPSGKICVMRPDSTTPIARVAATKLKTLTLPQRLYYEQTVYRDNPAHNGGSREIAQCGVELIGAVGRKADLEMLAGAIDALRSCGASVFHVELGHVDFFRELAARLDLDEEGAESLRQLVEGKNFAALHSFLEPHRANPACAVLERLSGCSAGRRFWTRRRSWRAARKPSTTCASSTMSCPPPDMGPTSGLTWAWSIKSTTTPAWYSGATWRGPETRYSLEAGMTIW